MPARGARHLRGGGVAPPAALPGPGARLLAAHLLQHAQTVRRPVARLGLRRRVAHRPRDPDPAGPDRARPDRRGADRPVAGELGADAHQPGAPGDRAVALDPRDRAGLQRQPVPDRTGRGDRARSPGRGARCARRLGPSVLGATRPPADEDRCPGQARGPADAGTLRGPPGPDVLRGGPVPQHARPAQPHSLLLRGSNAPLRTSDTFPDTRVPRRGVVGAIRRTTGSVRSLSLRVLDRTSVRMELVVMPAGPLRYQECGGSGSFTASRVGRR